MQSESPTDVEVRHNPAASRFEATVGGHLCHTDYRRTGDMLAMTHTEVPAALAGRGIAATLVQAAVQHAREHHLKLTPYCSFVRAYVERHPDVLDVIAAA